MRTYIFCIWANIAQYNLDEWAHLSSFIFKIYARDGFVMWQGRYLKHLLYIEIIPFLQKMCTRNTDFIVCKISHMTILTFCLHLNEFPTWASWRWKKQMGAGGHQLWPISQVITLAIVTSRYKRPCLHSQVMFWKCRVMPLHLHPHQRVRSQTWCNYTHLAEDRS